MSSILRTAALPLAVMALAAAAMPARADLNVCNDSLIDEAISVAVAYSAGGDQWVAEGWWVVFPDECATVLVGDLRNRYYYVRGEGSDGGTWSDDYLFCIHPTDEFVIADASRDCVSRGYEDAGFFEIDVGTATDWTQGLDD